MSVYGAVSLALLRVILGAQPSAVLLSKLENVQISSDSLAVS